MRRAYVAELADAYDCDSAALVAPGASGEIADADVMGVVEGDARPLARPAQVVVDRNPAGLDAKPERPRA